jgi:hypothetical protein
MESRTKTRQQQFLVNGLTKAENRPTLRARLDVFVGTGGNKNRRNHVARVRRMFVYLRAEVERQRRGLPGHAPSA